MIETGLTETGPLVMKGKIIVFAQFVFIVLFVYALSSEYRANPYQQDWILSNAWPLQYFLNGYLAAGLVGVMIGGAVLLAADYMREKKRRLGINRLARS